MSVKEKIIKIVIFILSIIGILFILWFLNHISEGNAANIGLGNFILMLIGFRKLTDVIGDAILNFESK